jgi:hypothetical protein
MTKDKCKKCGKELGFWEFMSFGYECEECHKLTIQGGNNE